MRCLSLGALLLLLLGLQQQQQQQQWKSMVATAFAPVSPAAIHPSPSRRASTARSKSSGPRFVFERMSEDCVAAVVAAQEQTARLQLETVDTPTLLAGCVDRPESAALQRTLKQYRITYRRVETALAALSIGADDRDRGWLSGLRAAADNKNDRPFSAEAKSALQRAARLADRMGSTTVRSHHVFLSLLDYAETGDTGEASATDGNNAWRVLQKMNVLDDDATALTICRTLLQNLRDTDQAAAADERELVTGKGSGDAKTPTLSEVGVDLTQQAELGLLDPVFGRDAEIRSCVRTLIRRRKNNVCLIGDAGVGKTAIAEGVAQVLVSEDCPRPLRGHRLVSVELSRLVAGTKYRGEFEERLQAVIAEVLDEKAPPTILFFDEIHNLVGAGGAEGGLDASNQLKPALARGQLQVIGATTIAEYRQYIEKVNDVFTILLNRSVNRTCT